MALTNFLGKGENEEVPEETGAQELKIAQAVTALSSDASFWFAGRLLSFILDLSNNTLVRCLFVHLAVWKMKLLC